MEDKVEGIMIEIENTIDLQEVKWSRMVHLVGRVIFKMIEEAPCLLIKQITIKEMGEMLIPLGKLLFLKGIRGTFLPRHHL